VVKVTLADGTKINRSLKKFTDDLSASGFSDDQLKKLFADMDVSPRFTNFVLSGEGLVMVRAWETVFSSPVLRKDPSKLTKVSRYLDNNPSKRPAFKAEFDLTPSARQSDFVDRVSRFDDLKVANSTASFSTQGLARSDIPQTTINQMIQQASAPQYLDGVINSCSTVPVRVPVSPGDKLFKIVPKGGDTPSSVTPYWLNESELNRLATDASLEQKLGLPIVSHGAKYDVYEIALKPGQSADVFESTVASTVEGAYSTTGGGLQSLVLDRAKWSSPQKLSREIFPPAQ
jgi:hypothetical protein